MMSRLAKGVSAAALLALGSLTGCGSSDDDLSAYIGTWQFAGTQTITCQSLGMGTNPIMSTISINKGIDSPLAVVSGTCTLKIDPSGNAATLRAGQSCPPMSGVDATLGPYTETDTYQMGSIAIIGRTASVSESGTAVLNFANNGATSTCTFVTTGTMTKATQ